MFGVSHGGKLRARGDLRRNLVDICTAILTPITLPTWDRLAQMAKHVFASSKDWAFLKGGHASAYKQLPLDPKHANLTVIALRNPKSAKWVGFVPNVLLCGSVSAVLHYNCFSRPLEILVNRCIGIPACNYYDDFGPFTPKVVMKEALDTFPCFTETLWANLNGDKSECKFAIAFLCLKGEFPRMANNMLRNIFLPPGKIEL